MPVRAGRTETHGVRPECTKEVPLQDARVLHEIHNMYLADLRRSLTRASRRAPGQALTLCDEWYTTSCCAHSSCLATPTATKVQSLHSHTAHVSSSFNCCKLMGAKRLRVPTYLSAHHGEAVRPPLIVLFILPRSPAQPRAAEQCLGRARNAVERRPASLLLRRSV